METLINDLHTKNLTIGLAESMTGGSLSYEFVKIPGVSSVFKGSIVCYQESIKTEVLKVSPSLIETYGVVSREVAVDMAEKAMQLLHTHVALSVTGYAENNHDIWISCLYGSEISVKKLNFVDLSRVQIIESTVKEMINLCKASLIG